MLGLVNFASFDENLKWIKYDLSFVQNVQETDLIYWRFSQFKNK